MPEKTPIQPAEPTMKHHFIQASITAGIILVVVLFFWITFKVIPAVFSNGSNFVATTLSSTFIPAPTATTTPAAPNNTTTQTAPVQQSTATNEEQTYTAPTQTYYGLPELSVSLDAIGIIDPGSQEFMETPYAGENDTIAIEFEVTNIGTNVSGPWQLSLNMPSRTTPYYISGDQVSLKPGDRVKYIATFTDPTNAQGINTAYITVDPFNQVDQSTRANNSLTVPIDISGSTYSDNVAYDSGSTNVVEDTATTPYGTMFTWTDIKANCFASPQTSYPGNMVSWYATASGGNGYYAYSWTGSNNLTADTSSVNETYDDPGTQTAMVTVTSGGESVTATCNMYVE